MNNEEEFLRTKVVVREGIECSARFDQHHNRVGPYFFTPEQQRKRDAAEAARTKPTQHPGTRFTTEELEAVMAGPSGQIATLGIGGGHGHSAPAEKTPKVDEAAAIAALFEGTGLPLDRDQRY